MQIFVGVRIAVLIFGSTILYGESGIGKVQGPASFFITFFILINTLTGLTFLFYIILHRFRRNLLNFINIISKDFASERKRYAGQIRDNAELSIHVLLIVGLGTMEFFRGEVLAFVEIRLLQIWQGLGGKHETRFSEMKWWMIVISGIITYSLHIDLHIARLSAYTLVFLVARTFRAITHHFVRNVIDTRKYCTMRKHEVWTFQEHKILICFVFI